MKSTISDTDPRLVDLLGRWQLLREGGGEPCLSDLTADPELLTALEVATGAILVAEKGPGGDAAPASARAEGLEGRYEVFGPPAVGGMGEVYRARDVQMNGRVVAYKVMKASRLHSPGMVQQFYREAVITDELRQPGVVPIYAKFLDGSGRPAYAMEFVEGENLYEAIKGLPSREVAEDASRPGLDLLRRFLDACRIVGVAHRKGYVHADLNPKNIMLIEGLKATRVVDWGSALKVGSEDETRPGHAVAPDHRDPALGPWAPPTYASDVYALGVCLRRLVEALAATDEPLLEGRKRASALRILGSIAGRATHERPEGRYPTADALADDLQRFSSHQRVLADVGEPLGERYWRWASRHRAGVSAAVAIMLLGSVSAGLLTFAFGRAALKEKEARQSRELTLSSRVAAIMATCELIAMENGGSFLKLEQDRAEHARLLRHVIESRDQNPEVVSETLEALRKGLTRQDQLNSEAAEKRRLSVERNLDEGVELLGTLLRDYPEHARPYRIRLANAYYLLGIVGLGHAPGHEELTVALQKILAGKPDDRPRRAAYESALGLFEKAMAILPAFAPDAPAADPVRRAWQEFYTGKMSVLLFLGRCTEALQAMDGSIAVSGGPDNAFLVGMRKTLRMAAEMEQSHMPWSRPTGADHAKAVRMADYLAAQEGVSDAAIFNAACALALASRDQECGAAERRARADRAMNYLLRIAGKGYFQKLRLFPLPPRNTIHELHTDDALDPLRDRPDFRALADRFRDGK